MENSTGRTRKGGGIGQKRAAIWMSRRAGQAAADPARIKLFLWRRVRPQVRSL
ncbi:MAG: hypothetical protein KAV00_09810 [Phycisphaerae bacterium]|nr:hypothetical protein [Phycisphaerae bacterium]